MLATAAVSLLICSTNRQRGTAAPDYIPVISGADQPTNVTLRSRAPAQGSYARALAVTHSETPTVVLTTVVALSFLDRAKQKGAAENGRPGGELDK